MYFKVKPDSYLTWTLIEQSTDETGETVVFFFFVVKIKNMIFNFNTVHRPLSESEDPSEVVDFWGKSKVGNHDYHYKTAWNPSIAHNLPHNLDGVVKKKLHPVSW